MIAKSFRDPLKISCLWIRLNGTRSVRPTEITCLKERKHLNGVTEKCWSHGRDVKIAANVVSFSLYASLGFLPVECWQELEGCVTEEQSLSASRSVGLQPHPGTPTHHYTETTSRG